MAILKKAACALALSGLLAAVPAAAAQRSPAPVVKSDVRASTKVKKAERAVGAEVVVIGALAGAAAVYGVVKAVEGAPASP